MMHRSWHKCRDYADKIAEKYWEHDSRISNLLDELLIIFEKIILTDLSDLSKGDSGCVSGSSTSVS